MGFKSLFNRKKKSDSSSTSPTQSPVESTHSREQFQELEHVFKKFDVNGDGKISAAELGSILASLGHSATDDELQSMIQEVDADGDGCIDLNEFVELNTKGVDSDDFLENLRDAFKVYDIDKNGSISAEELHEVLRSLGDESSIADCRNMISAVDSDGDGMINFEEFKVMMMTGSRFDGRRSPLKNED